MDTPYQRAPLMSADGATCASGPDAEALKRADEIKHKLDEGSLSANQRKKYRKKLSRLFNVDAPGEDAAQPSSDFSGMFGEAGSACTQPAHDSGGRDSLAAHAGASGREEAHARPSKRAKKQQQQQQDQQPVRAAGGRLEHGAPQPSRSKGSVCSEAAHSSRCAATVNPVLLHDPVPTKAAAGTVAGLARGVPSPAGSQAVGGSDSVTAAPPEAQPQAGPAGALTAPHQQQRHPGYPPAVPFPRPLVHTAMIPAHARRPPPVPGRRGAPADLSSVMHLIACELKAQELVAPEVSAGAAAAWAQQQAQQAVGASPPSSSVGRSFCRLNLSQEMSVISAELTMSVPGSKPRQQGEDSGQSGSDCGEGQGGGRPPQAGTSGADMPPPSTSTQQGQRKQKKQERGQQQTGVQGPQVEAEQQQGVKKKSKKMFIHGNYHNYYGYRALGTFDADPRLKVLQAAWFQGREVLDVGCNEGLVTLAVAAAFGCSRTTGVDIDATLVKRAKSNLKEMRVRLSQQISSRHHVKERPAGGPGGHAVGLAAAIISGSVHASSGAQPGMHYQGSASAAVVSGTAAAVQHPDAAGGSPTAAVAAAGSGAGATPAAAVAGGACDELGLRTGTGRASGSASGAPTGERHLAAGLAGDRGCVEAGPSSADGAASSHQHVALRQALKALNRTQFKKQDWSKGRTKEQSYDTIMCLSVTKWVHLNGGDVALKRLFKKMYDSLTPGGYLVLEPQPWRSYRSAVTKRQTCSVPFRRIDQLQLRPEGFLQHLTQELGFVHVADLNTGSTAHNFDRPFYVLQRPQAAAAAAAGVLAVAPPSMTRADNVEEKEQEK